MLFRDMATVTDRNRDQAYSEETFKGSYPTGQLWNHRAGAKALEPITRRINAQYFQYPAVERHLP